jgi:hypothetical protein
LDIIIYNNKKSKMGYSTDFEGSLSLTPPATKEQTNYINLLSSTRRMKRDVNTLFDIYKGKCGNPFAENDEEIYGNDGEYFARNDGSSGQSQDKSILDFNTPPGQLTHEDYRIMGPNAYFTENVRRTRDGECQPGLWCQWIINENGTELMWDGGEKFYEYIPWLKYYISHFFEKWGIKLNGEIRYQGEDHDDNGVIVVEDNFIGKRPKKRIYSPEDPYGEEDW